MVTNTNKKYSNKSKTEKIWDDENWAVFEGRLIPGPGRPTKTVRLFSIIGEKLPFECLAEVRKNIEIGKKPIEGVYLAHDSMGYARYGGRGKVFARLSAHKNEYPLQLMYFSFYQIANKAHEREIETVLLRAAGPQMILNTRKIASGIAPGNVKDYEPGTIFFERRARGDNFE